MTINPLIDKLKNLPIEDLAWWAVMDTKDRYLALNREQMYEGKRSDGQDITPGYLDDPFFKTKEAAQEYSDWKDRITPNPKRKKGTPNLFINGWYHESITISINGDSIDFNSSWDESKDIEAKFDKIYGLNEDKRTKYVKILRPVFMEMARTLIKL